jgi:hypothetical protein
MADRNVSWCTHLPVCKLKEEVCMKFVRVLKGKLLVTVLVAVALLGGATAVFAATPAGQGMVPSITRSQSATAVLDGGNHKGSSNQDAAGHGTTCPGLPEAQQLATQFALSTDSRSDAIQALCALHGGTFKGTTSSGASVSSSRVYGYGEIEMLLTYAQYLASHDQASTSRKLTGENVRTYLAQALHNCGTTPLETCLRASTPGSQLGNDKGKSGTGKSNGNRGSSGNGHGKPTSTPTPPPHP